MSPCKFMDQEDKVQKEPAMPDRNGQSINPKQDNAELCNYWLNEIKSQEDTARQIMTICIILLGASITLITSNSNGIILTINNAANMTFQAYLPIIPEKYLPEYVSMFKNLISFFMSISILSFLLVWILALNKAIESLKVEPINSKAPQYSEHLSFIANIKHSFCEKAAHIIITGTLLMAIFVIGLLLITSQNANSQIGSFAASLAALILQLYVSEVIIKELKAKRASHRHPLTPPLSLRDT